MTPGGADRQEAADETPTVIADAPTVIEDPQQTLAPPAGSSPLSAPRGAPPQSGEAGGRHDQIGSYRIEEELGRGGMGVVYRARHEALDRPVALKVMLAGAHAGGQLRERFHLEARAAARLRHPNLVAIHDVGETAEGVSYLVMDLIQGEPLDHRLKREPLTQEAAAGIVAQLAAALDYAHQQMILHRDVKPANVILESSGRPLLTDFGLAKQLESDQGPTLSGQVIGTPAFMAPEQAGGGLLDARTDVYGLGALLYCCLVGDPPFLGSTTLEVVNAVLNKEPVHPSRFTSVDRDLETICLTCLAKEPTGRYDTAGALAADLRRYLAGDPIQARRPSLWQREMRALRRNQKASWITSLAVVGLVTALCVLLYRVSERSRWTMHGLRLESRYPSLRAEAARTLTRYVWRDSAPLLLEALTREDEPSVQETILRAVERRLAEGRSQPNVALAGPLLVFLVRDDVPAEIHTRAWRLLREAVPAGSTPPSEDELGLWTTWWASLEAQSVAR